jgi:hypothetical protein
MSKTKQDSVKTIKDCQLSGFDLVIAIFGHEIEHGADPANVAIRIMERLREALNGLDSEIWAQKRENLILHELVNKKKE